MIRSVMKAHGVKSLEQMMKEAGEFGVRIHVCEMSMGVMGLKDRIYHQPAQLSGGEQQRVAIARAMINKPILILADEPTGNLDPDTSTVVFAALSQLVRHEGAAALIATHNFELTKYMDRVMALDHHKLVAKG